MKENILLAAILMMPLSLGALTAPGSMTVDTGLSAQETITVELEVQNTSQLPDNQFLLEIMAELKNYPAEFDGKDVNICVGHACERIDFMHFMSPQVETIGLKETVAPSQFARDVAGVVSSAVGGVHGSASVKVKYSETSKKGADGSIETSKTVDVSVTVSGGKN